MAEIVMPRLSDTMEEGTILRWLKSDGEHVARGEELVEIETDKAAMVYESDEEGLLRILAGEGETLAVGARIAQVGEEETEGPSSAPETEGPEGGGPDAEGPEGGGPDAEGPDANGPEGGGPPADGPEGGSSPSPPSAPDGERVKASPVARRVARERGVDLRGIAGSGPGGRIVRADVEGSAGGAAQSAPAGETDSAQERSGTPGADTSGESPAPTLSERVATAKGETTIVELTRTQQTIARRMAESKATIPDFSLQMEIDMEACVALRAELKRLSPEEAPTYNDMIVKACALALREHPRANGSYRDGKLQLHSRVNVGIAVASEDALVVPTVFDAEFKSLGEIARETRALAERVRAGTVTPPELSGGTFTVSATWGCTACGASPRSSIPHKPRSCAVGSLARRAVVHAGGADAGRRVDDPQRGESAEIVARHTLTVTLVCDHRVLYGADAARFLARIRELLEEPAALTL